MPLLGGRNILAQSESGTGRSSACAIAILAMLDLKASNQAAFAASSPPSSSCRILVLVPSLSHAHSLSNLLRVLGEFCSNAADGAASYYSSFRPGEDDEVLAQKKVLIGTPKRVKQWMQQEKSQSKGKEVQLVIVEELEQMATKGCLDDISCIFSALPASVQRCFLCASLTPTALAFARAELRSSSTSGEPVVRIRVTGNELSLSYARHCFMRVDSSDAKLDALIELLSHSYHPRNIVYCNSRRRVEWVAEKLRRALEKLPVLSIHCDSTDAEVFHAQEWLRTQLQSGRGHILVTMDSSIDFAAHLLPLNEFRFSAVVLAIDFPLEQDAHHYLQRFGGRHKYARIHIGISLILPEDTSAVRAVEKLSHEIIEELQPDEF